MDDSIRVLGVSGSLRRGGLNTTLLHVAAKLSSHHIELEMRDLITALPHYNLDLDGENAPAVVTDMRSVVTTAEAVLIASPEYNYAIPGGLKNWIDWATRPFGAHGFVNKPVAVITASPSSRGGAAAAAYLADILPKLGANLVAPPLMIAAAQQKVNAEDLTVDEHSDEIIALLDALADAVRVGRMAAPSA
jgi:chromate reductase